MPQSNRLPFLAPPSSPLALNAVGWDAKDAQGTDSPVPEVHVAVNQQGHKVGEIPAGTAATQEHRHGGHLVQREDEGQQEGQQRQDAELAERGQPGAQGPADVRPEVVHVHGAAQPQHGDAQGGAHQHVQPVVQRRVPERGLVGGHGPGERGSAQARRAARQAAARRLRGRRGAGAETGAGTRPEAERGAGAGAGGRSAGDVRAGAQAAGIGRQRVVVRLQGRQGEEQGCVVGAVHGAGGGRRQSCVSVPSRRAPSFDRRRRPSVCPSVAAAKRGSVARLGRSPLTSPRRRMRRVGPRLRGRRRPLAGT